MSMYLNSFIDEDTIACGVCKETFNTNEITTDDFNFAWDNLVSIDCCNDCLTVVKIKTEIEENEN